MLSKILLFIPILLLTACDNVDISKYPEFVQQCYNGIIYSDNYCGISKKITVRYCECCFAKQGDIYAKQQELNDAAVAAGMFYGSAVGPLSGFAALGAQSMAQKKLDMYRKQLYTECAEKVGFTTENCKIKIEEPKKEETKKQDVEPKQENQDLTEKNDH